MNIKLSKKSQQILVKAPQDAAKIMRQILKRDNSIGREREHFWIMGLDEQHYITYVELIGLGGETPAEPTVIFKMAIYKDAARIILCHSRRETKQQPTPDDKMITDRLIQVGLIVNIEVYDHIIISSAISKYYSFRDTGLLAKLKEDSVWTPKFKNVELIEELAATKKALGIAANMRKHGIPDETICQITGLSLERVKKL